MNSPQELEQRYHQMERLLDERFTWITLLNELTQHISDDVHMLLKEQRTLEKQRSQYV